MKYIAGCSMGKDSLAMVLNLIARNYPLDEVIYYNNGMDYQAIYNIRDKLIPILEAHGIRFTELHPDIPFVEKMFNIAVRNRDGSGYHNGYSWCGGVCRWGTTDKTNTITRYLEPSYNDYCEYVGIAYDEQQRIKEKIYPLVEWKMTEADCLKYCRDRGWNWFEGNVDLYDILKRVSCWCCGNKNKDELRNMYLYLPQYWEQLKALQSRTHLPMKKFSSKKYGNYGNVFDMEKVFREELNANDEVTVPVGYTADELDRNNPFTYIESR